jgi:type I restriction enzyme S subunit
MSGAWPLVPLGDLLTKSAEFITLDPEATYSEVKVRLWGNGVALRRKVTGAEIAATQRLVIRQGQFLVSRIDARKGAFGLVPDSLDGAVVSNDFPAFSINRSRLLPGYLVWLSKTPAFVEMCNVASEGTTNRVRVKEDRLLATAISLPPLDEQRRIVARIEALADRIAEANRLREEAVTEADVLFDSARTRLFAQLTAPRRAIADLFDLINGRAFQPTDWGSNGRKIIRIQNLKYPTATYNFYNGPVDKKHLVMPGDVLFAWSGQVVSLGAHIWQQEEAVLNQHIFKVIPKVDFDSRFVQEGFNALVGEMKHQVRGLEMFHIRKQELNRLQFPLLPLGEQRQVVSHLDEVQAQVDNLRTLQSETAAELDALLPAVLAQAFAGRL